MHVHITIKQTASVAQTVIRKQVIHPPFYSSRFVLQITPSITKSFSGEMTFGASVIIYATPAFVVELGVLKLPFLKSK